MSASFDPYYRWLSIPPTEQPPTHYRLLGLPAFESDAQVISSAAQRQIGHVRRYRDTPLAAYAQNLVNELEVARHCLTDPEAKAAYDAWLQNLNRGEAAPRSIDSLSTAASRPLAYEPLETPWSQMPGFAPTVVATTRRRRKVSSATWFYRGVMWLVGAAIGLLAGYAVLCMIDPRYDFLHLMFTEEANGTAVRQTEPPPTNPQANAVDQLSPPARVPRRSRRSDSAFGGIARPLESADDSAASTGIVPQRREPRDNENWRIQQTLSSLPKSISLPPTTIVGESTNIMAIPDEIAERVNVNLIDGGDDKKGELSLEAPADREATNRSWTVLWLPQAGDPAADVEDEPLDVGAFVVAGGELRFGWGSNVSADPASAAKNSLIKLTVGTHSRIIALREPEKLPMLTIDLKKSTNQMLYRCDDVPSPGDVRVDVELVEFPRNVAETGSLRGLKISDEVEIRYPQYEGVVSQIALLRRGSRLFAKFESRFRWSTGREQPLTNNKWRDELNQLTSSLDEAKRAESELPQLRSRLRDLQQQPKSLPQQREIEATNLQIANLSTLAAQIPQLTAGQEFITNVGNLAQSLHNKSRIKLRFYRLLNGHEVDLAVSEEK